jgi:hypothetical protein
MAAITSNSDASAAKVYDFGYDGESRVLSYTFREKEDYKFFHRTLFEKYGDIHLFVVSDCSEDGVISTPDSDIRCRLTFPESRVKQYEQYKLRFLFANTMGRVSMKAMDVFEKFCVETAPALSVERLYPPERACLLPFCCSLNEAACSNKSSDTPDAPLARFAKSSIFEPRVMNIVSEFLL